MFYIAEPGKTIYIVDLFWKKTNKVSLADTGLRKRESNPRHQTRVQWLSYGEQPPLRFGAITCKLRPIEIGVTNRIRAGTNAFTGRDAAVTS